MNTHQLKEIERRIEDAIDDIVEDFEVKYIEDIEHDYSMSMDDLIDAAISDIELTLLLTARALDEHQSIASELSGEEIVEHLLQVDDSDDDPALMRVVNFAIDCSTLKPSYGPVMPAGTIAYLPVGETNFTVNPQRHSRLAELVQLLPDDHELKRTTEIELPAYPCDKACLVLDADTFIGNYQDHIDQLIMDRMVHKALS